MELDALRCCTSEDDLIKILEIVNDKLKGGYYSQSEALLISEILVQYNFSSFNYETKEEVLYVLSDFTAYYRLNGKLDAKRIAAIKNDVGDDLKEYVEEILENIRE